jgi:hypothetical protein
MDEELLLHLAALSTGVAIVVDGGTTQVETPLQGRHDAVPECALMIRLHRAGRREWVEAGSVKCFVGVDVSDPGYGLLVQEEGFEGRGPALGGSRERFGRELLR